MATTTQRLRRLVGIALALGLTVTACGGGDDAAGDDDSASAGSAQDEASAAGDDVLRLVLTTDPSPLDPDTYYESEGIRITRAAYEGLLRYDAEGELVPSLAESWEVSPDGLTYTFTLREGVTFADGTPFDSSAAKASFERRIAINGGAGYMLAGIVDMQTPDPLTFVVTLSAPDVSFLGYQASAWGPVMISPTAVEANDVGGDLAAGWLATHTAGTGPYQLTDVRPAELYTLTANPTYWGGTPGFDAIELPVVADFPTQRLQLEQGDLDVVGFGMTLQDLQSLSSTDGIEVVTTQSSMRTLLSVNPESPVFADQAVRNALQQYLDRGRLTEEFYGPYASPATDVFGFDVLPEGAAPDVATPDPDALAAALAPYQGQKITLGYYVELNLGRLADLIQLDLQAAGLDVTVQPFQASAIFALPTDPTQRPDLLLGAWEPDTLTADNFARIYWYTDSPLNFLGCSVPEGDAKIAEAGSLTDEQAFQDAVVAAAIAYRDSGCWVSIADGDGTFAVRDDLTGIDTERNLTGTLRVAGLGRG